MSSPISHAPVYRDKGWLGTLPVPFREKRLPPAGFTGLNGRWPTEQEVEQWSRRADNIALRLPAEVKGFDVDAYDDKGGADTLAALEAEHGMLPPTWRSTSRDDGVSGVRLYRVPGDLGNVADLGSGIEVCQFGWRYVMVYPSVHPSGAVYAWFGPDGDQCDPPALEDLPALPAAWVTWLRERRDRARLVIRPQPRHIALSDEGQEAARVEAGRYIADKIRLMTRLPAAGPDAQWDLTVFGVARDLVRLGNSWWSPFTHAELLAHFEGACDLLAEGKPGGRLSPEQWQAVMADKWDRALSQVEDAVDVPDEVERVAARRDRLDGSNAADLADTLTGLIGTGPLSGIYKRGSELIRYRAMTEDGFDASTHGSHHVNKYTLTPIIDERYYVFQWTGEGDARRRRHTMADKEAVSRAIDRAVEYGNLPEVRYLTHVPLVKPDGTLHGEPGYEGDTRCLYLPTRDRMPSSARRAWESGREAREWLLSEKGDGGIFGQVAWAGDGEQGALDSRATYLAALLTPLLEMMLPPPWPLVAISAPDRGTGKTLLADCLKALYGGLSRGYPPDAEEFRKSVTSVLMNSTGKVIVFDNIERQVGNDELSRLLTGAVWSDRKMGGNEQAELPNDRLWVVTGNNIAIRSDQRRRTAWITLDANVEKPWERAGFRIPALESWVEAHWEEVILALAAMVREWVEAGRPLGDGYTRRSDSFGFWLDAVNGILSVSGAVGRVGRSERDGGLVENAEWAALYAALEAEYGVERSWTVKDVLMQAKLAEAVAGAVGDVRGRNVNVNRVLGNGLSKREGTWIDGRKMVRDGSEKRAVRWRVESKWGIQGVIQGGGEGGEAELDADRLEAIEKAARADLGDLLGNAESD